MNRVNHSSRLCRHARNRRGQSLILIFFALIALIGVMALTLDYGFILLARRQMQTGVNAAALEGARDMEGDGRQLAADLLRNVYDEDLDLDPAQNDTTIGAGIGRSLIQGDGYQMMTIGEGNGLGNTLANRSSFVYRPDPQLNEDNEPHGDFARGDYDDDVQPMEDQTYDRGEHFIPNPSGNAFLARLRRTHNPCGLDQVPGISSSGGGLPLLIGNLAWFGATVPIDLTDPADPMAPKPSYSIRRDGVTVRATAIAEQHPVVLVGASTDPAVHNSLKYAFDLDTTSWFEIVDPRHALGETVEPLLSSPISEPVETGYAPLVISVEGNFYIVGFRLLNRDPARPFNASPRLQDVWNTLSSLDEETRNTVLNRFRALSTSNVDFATVPALVRSVR